MGWGVGPHEDAIRSALIGMARDALIETSPRDRTNQRRVAIGDAQRARRAASMERPTLDTSIRLVRHLRVATSSWNAHVLHRRDTVEFTSL
jgi:hypothetical protein